MTAMTLIAIGPYEQGPLPNRPTELLAATEEALRPDRTVVVTRTRPTRFIRAGSAGAGALGHVAGFAMRHGTDGRRVKIAHPWPFGWAETTFLDRLIATERRRVAGGTVVIVVSDPKCAPVFDRLQGSAPASLALVFDAYDAWDRSPLVRGDRRRRAALEGYRAAGRAADLVVTNTPEMARRLEEVGARRVRVIPNAGPGPQPPLAKGVPPYLAYVGRIHERIDTRLLAAVADASPATMVRIAGPLERRPAGWDELIARPNVILEGPLTTDAARRFVGAAAALLVPHVVDDYTLSQDAMKAWEAAACDTRVVSTAVPPVTGWPLEAGVAALDGPSFVAAAMAALTVDPAEGREIRRRLATDHTWAARGNTLAREIRAVLDR